MEINNRQLFGMPISKFGFKKKIRSIRKKRVKSMSYQLTKEELRNEKKRREEFKNVERNDIYILF